MPSYSRTPPRSQLRVLAALAAGLTIASPAAAQQIPPGIFDRAGIAEPAAGEVRSVGWPTANAERPPVVGGRVAAQLLGGVAGGVAGSLVMSAALYPFFADAEWGALSTVAGGVLLGYPAGATAGVYLVGNRGSQRGSYFATLVGAVAGAATALPLVNATNGVSYLVLVPVGATTGFTLSRRAAPAPQGVR